MQRFQPLGQLLTAWLSVLENDRILNLLTISTETLDHEREVFSGLAVWERIN
jgi:hypothetical protein